MTWLLTTWVFLSAWLALSCYTASLLIASRERHRPPSLWPRRFWWAAAFLYLSHVLSAFAIFYDWSHLNALADVRRRSLALTGFETGWGIYLNYALGIVWFAEALRWSSQPDRSYRHRPRWQFVTLHAFSLFMLFNGAVVFVPSPSRWFGLVLFLASLLSCLLILRSPRHDSSLSR